ncbi:MAG: LCP family protein [Firmicutes bacterium]|nr:LCP family protein [Bacillota bacterium]
MLSEEEVLRRKAELEERRAWKRRYRRRQAIIYSICFIIAIILMIISARYTYHKGVKQTTGPAAKEERLLVLFLGTDEKAEASSRADTIMLLSLDTKTGDAGVLSIPRDTRVWVPSRQRWERINSVYAHGGPTMIMEAVTQLVGAPVRYYVHTDFQGFQEMVDLLGGVEINVPRRMHYVDNAQGLYIDISPGLQVLDGERALQFVRFRDRLGDVSLVDPFNDQYDGRVERQRQFVEALISKVLSSASLTKLPQLVTQTFKIVDTNLPWETVFNLALNASKFSVDKMKTSVLPGNSQVINDAWYWIVNDRKAGPIIESVILGKPEPLRVMVLNGSGRSGIAQEVAELLRSYGYNVVSHGNAEHFNFQTTQVVATPGDSERVKPLAEFLGASIQEVDEGIEEVTVIIGKDFTLKSERSVGI